MIRSCPTEHWAELCFYEIRIIWFVSTIPTKSITLKVKNQGIRISCILITSCFSTSYRLPTPSDIVPIVCIIKYFV